MAREVDVGEVPALADENPDAVHAIAHAEPLPAYTWRMDRRLDRLPTPRPGVQVQNGADDLVMPGYGDELPLFPRGGAWEEDELSNLQPAERSKVSVFLLELLYLSVLLLALLYWSVLLLGLQ